MKRVCIFLTLMMSIVMVFPSGARAQDGDLMTQGELARLLVNVLGLHQFLPANPTAFACARILMDNGIAPADGWEVDKVVTKADLARVVVLSMGMVDEVDDPDDPLSWVLFLESIGVSIETVGAATDTLEPLAEPVASHVFFSTTTVDPLRGRRTGEPDELEYGADAGSAVVSRPIIGRVLEEVVAPPPPRRPVTPD